MQIDKQLLERIVKDLPNYIFVKDTDLVYTLCNHNFIVATGGVNPIGKTDYELLWDKNSAKLYQEEDQYVLSTGNSILNKEVKMLLLNEKKYLSVSKVPLYNIKQKIVGILGFYIDITEKKKDQETIIQAKIAAEVANKAKTEFIINMSHDLRTPLTGMIGLSLILANEGSQVKDKKLGKWILNAARQLLELLNSVIEIAAAEYQVIQVKREKINLKELAKELHALIKPSIHSKGLSYEEKTDEHLPLILSDLMKLKRLLLNLLVNAIKFTQKGKISLEIRLLALVNNQAKIKIIITDTGIGIEKNNLDKIFDRFYRVYPSHWNGDKGYGIGLFLVKKSIEQLNGEIKVVSKIGEGSRFTIKFCFPLAEQSLEKLEKKSIASVNKNLEHDKKKGKILIVEDNPLALYALENMLIKLHYEVVTVKKGKLALRLLQGQSFNWALLDINLVDADGVDIVKQYRQWEKKNHRPHLPLFALTAHAESTVKEQCIQAGVDHIFNKPFQASDITIIQRLTKKLLQH